MNALEIKARMILVLQPELVTDVTHSQFFARVYETPSGFTNVGLFYFRGRCPRL
jgi:hypothetical protein